MAQRPPHADGPTHRGAARQGGLEVHPGGAGLARARQVNCYYNSLGEGLGVVVPPRSPRSRASRSPSPSRRSPPARPPTPGPTPRRRPPWPPQAAAAEAGLARRGEAAEVPPWRRSSDRDARRRRTRTRPRLGRPARGAGDGADGRTCRGTRSRRVHAGPDRGAPVSSSACPAGIAAYKAVEVCRRLVDAGVHVAPVLTDGPPGSSARRPSSALASEPAQTHAVGRGPRPSRTPGSASAPTSSWWRRPPPTSLARYAAGLADDLLTATLVATAAPGAGVPGHAHRDVGAPVGPGQPGHAARRAASTWSRPRSGRLAGGDIGRGPAGRARRASSAACSDAPGRRAGAPGDRRPGRGPGAWCRAGGTREPIDPVRFITNRSSGKQGHALADAAAAERGADVVAGHHQHAGRSAGRRGRSRWRRRPRWRTPCWPRPDGADVVVMAAAVADFRPKAAAGRKLHKADGIPELVLEPTPTSWPSWAPAPPGPGAGRVRRRDRRRRRAGAGQAGGQGRRPDGGQRRVGAGVGLRPRHQRGRPSSEPTGRRAVPATKAAWPTP